MPSEKNPESFGTLVKRTPGAHFLKSRNFKGHFRVSKFLLLLKYGEDLSF